MCYVHDFGGHGLHLQSLNFRIAVLFPHVANTRESGLILRNIIHFYIVPSLIFCPYLQPHTYMRSSMPFDHHPPPPK